MRSLVKKIHPKTKKAREFVEKHGDTFVIEYIGNNSMKIRSTKTQDLMYIGVDKNGKPIINGQIVDWKD